MEQVVVGRFWGPRGDLGAQFTLWGGYLADPAEEFGQSINKGLVRLSAIQHIPCLVLLGEPGIGKSTVLVQATESMKSGDLIVRVDLAELSTRQDILSRVFTGPEWDKWRHDPARTL